MSPLLERLRRWTQAGPVALATVVATEGSAPRPPGTAMAVSATGEIHGSVSGGCVEGAVLETAREVLATGQAQLRSFGYADEAAFEVGLTCGGRIEVFIERVTAADLPWDALLDAADGRRVAIETVIAHADPAALGRRTVVPAEHARTGIEMRDCGERVFVQAFAPPPRLIVFGVIDFAVALARIGAFLGDRVTVCDARPDFAVPSRFPGAEVVREWPHRYLAAEVAAGRVDERTAICVLTHDAKFDVPVLTLALGLDRVGFVGAMGSRRTHADRVERLRAAGVSDGALARLSSPIGLDLGGKTAEETALSIAAEIVARRRGGSGLPLGLAGGAIHRELTPA